jgi:Tubulin-tyrosine ligase family
MVNHNNNVFFCKEGYLRLTNQDFDLNSKSKFIHLTNNAIQKHSEYYKDHEDEHFESF